MSAFQNNLLRYNQINDALESHGLELTGGSIVDVTLPPYMHSFVCRFDHCAADYPENPLNHSEIAAYLDRGRKERIEKFQVEQAEARAWSNRI